MLVTFAGCGGAFCGPDQYQSNIVLTSSRNRRLLFDCGTDIRFSLGELGVTNYNIGDWLDGVYISHLHADHCGGLEFLGFCTALNGKKIKLFVIESLVDPLWDTLKGGMQFFRYGQRFSSLSDYFDVQIIKESADLDIGINQFYWAGNKFTTIKNDHVNNGILDMPVHGLFAECNSSQSGQGFNSKKTFYISADGRFKVSDAYLADVIFQDAETYSLKSEVHAHYDDLITLPEEVKRKMWLYHYSPKPIQNPIDDGFLGFIQKGQTVVI